MKRNAQPLRRQLATLVQQARRAHRRKDYATRNRICNAHDELVLAALRVRPLVVR
jgi:hypothetical protein